MQAKNLRDLLKKFKTLQKTFPVVFFFPMVFTVEQVEQLAQAAADPVEKLMVSLVNESPLHAQQLAVLQYNDLFDEQHVPRAPCSISGAYFLPSHDMQQKFRALSDFLRGKYTDAELRGACYVLNASNIHEPLTCDTFEDALQRVGQRAGLAKVSREALRLSLKHRLLQAGNPPECVARFFAQATPHSKRAKRGIDSE